MLFEIFNIYVLIEAVWIILPAYAANGIVPIFKGNHPIDFNKKLNKEPIFGHGKTWEGLIFGSLIGMVIAIIQQFAYPFLPWSFSSVTLTLVPMSFAVGLLLGFGAMIGDMVGSFIKRRFRIKRGDPAPLLDQEDFLLGSLFFASLLVMIKIEWVILLIIITPILHYATSIIGHRLKLKREPW